MKIKQRKRTVVIKKSA